MPGGVVVDLDAAEHDDAGDGEDEGAGVAPGAGHHGGDDDRPDELDGHALAEVGAVDGHVEERVHRRRGDAEHGRGGELAAGPAAPERAPRRRARRAAAPMTRIHATVCGATRSNSRTAIVAPTYWATAERTNSPSGEAVSRKRATAPAGGATAVRRTCPGGHVRHSKSSGSVRQISCHSGWKLNQPAKWPAGLPRPCTRRTRRGSARASPAAIAISCAWHERSIETNQNTASSTRLADREQAVVLVDRGLVRAERGGDLVAGLDLEHDGAALLGDDGVVAVEDAGVLGQRGERDAERARTPCRTASASGRRRRRRAGPGGSPSAARTPPGSPAWSRTRPRRGG